MARRMLQHFTATVGAEPCLELPFHIVNQHLCSGSLFIQGPEGAQYSVQVVKRHHKIYLADGWRKFEVDNGIKKGDILFCKLFQCSELLVEIEIIETKRMQNMFSTKNVDAKLQKTKTKRSDSANFQKVKLTDSSNNIQKVKDTEPSTNRVAMNIENTVLKAMQRSKDGGDKTMEEIMHNMVAAKKGLKNPSEIMEFTANKLKSKCELPRGFAAILSAQHGSMVDVTISGGKSKQVRWLSTSTFKGLGIGWRGLVEVHGIKLGDMALLELTSQNAITFYIYNCSTLAEKKIKLFAKSLKAEVQHYSKNISKPSIPVEVTKYRFDKELNFGTEFIRKHMLGLEYGDYVTFTCLDGCSHELRWTRKGGFCAGWSDFKRYHHLKIGDELVLEVLGPRTLKVHLFRLPTKQKLSRCVKAMD